MSLHWSQLSDRSLLASPNSSPNLAVCWMHGLGALAYDFKEIVEFIESKYNIGATWLLPQAPSMPVAINNNAIMPAWYNIYSTTEFSKQDLAGINASSHSISEWCKGQKIPIVLIGFSQGGALALYTGLINKLVSHVIGLSTYLPVAYELDKNNELNNNLNVMMMHGKFDDVISVSTARASAHKISQLINKQINLDLYPISHTVCEDQIAKVGDYLKNL